MSHLPKLRIVSTALALLFCASTQAAHYKVFLLGGQSNMTGNATKTSDLTEAQKAPQDDVWIYGGADESVSKLGPLQPGYGSSYGPELGFGRTIADGRPYENFALIKYSKGGTNLYNDWDPTTGNIYNRLKTTVGFGLEALTKAGHTYEVVGMLWTQGERDAGNGRTTAEYEADLNEFIADIRTRYGAGVAFFISRLSILQTGREPGLHDIRAAQDNVAAADPNAYLIDTDSFDMGGDNLHFTGTGIVELGNAFGQAYLNSLPVDASAPQIDTLSPVHTASAVEPTANLSITFDEEVVFGTGDITLRQTGGTLIESYDVAAPSTNLTLSGNTLTIDPSSLLAASTGYYIEIAATAIEDHAGNPFAGISGDGIWSFTTSAGDASAPTLNALSPANGATNVKINQDLSITFSENIAFSTGNIELRLATGGTLVASYDVANPPANLSILGGTLTINPTSDLAPSTGYYVEIDAAALDDHAGNSFAGLDGSGAWAFTTAAPVIDGSEITATASRTDFNSNGTARGTPDKTIDGSGLSGGEHGSATGTYCLAPTTIYNPVESQWFQWDLGASHTLGSIHVWNFDLRSVDIYFSNVAIPGGTGSGNWTRLGGASLELPAAGSPNTGFDLATATGTTLPTTEVRYIRFEANTNWSGGNGVALSEIQFSASPAAADETPPDIQTLSPTHTATGVALASNLSVTFNEDVAFGTGEIRLLQSGGTLIESFNVASPPAGLTRSGGTVTLNPTADLAQSTTYYVEIDDTAIDDLSDNSFSGFSGDGTWSFTSVSADTTPPTIHSLTPTHTATGIGYSSNLVINFSENVAFGTGEIRLLQSGGALVESFDVASPPANLTLSGSSVTLNPTADLAPATTYYVEIDATAINDLVGNSFAGFANDGTWRFTTFVPDTTLPTISTLSPTNSSTGVPMGANLVITFSENIDFGTGEIRLLQSGGTLIASFDVATDPSGLTLSGATVTLNPASDLALATTYYVEIDATAIDDLAGNSFAGFNGEGTWGFTTSNSASTAAITYVGSQFDIDHDDSRTTDGWHSSTLAKPLDIDGNSVLGSDGYLIYRDIKSNPTYATVTAVAPNKNSGWGLWDDPSNTSGSDIGGGGAFHDAGAGIGDTTVALLQFVITDAIPLGETLRVGVLFDVVGGTGTAQYILEQTVGGTAIATTPGQDYDAASLDVAFFDVTDVSIGDTFVIKAHTVSATGYGAGFEQVGGITFDTGVISLPGETFADWIGGYTGLNDLTAFDDDADGDGNKNGVENYFGTHPGEFSQGLITGTVTGSTMTFTHPLNDSPASNLSATYRWSKDLSSFHADGDTFEDTTVTFNQGTPAAGMVTTTATITGTPLDQLFVDIEVTEN